MMDLLNSYNINNMNNKEKISKMQRNIDNIYGLSLLQKDFLKLILWSSQTYGCYNYSIENVEKKYEKLKDDFDIKAEMDELISSNFVSIKNKKQFLEVNIELLKR